MAKGKGSEEECMSVQLSSRWALLGLKPDPRSALNPWYSGGTPHR